MYKVIDDFNNYAVSEQGHIKNIKTGRILIGGTDNSGYKIVTLRKNNKNYTKTVHRLVAKAFIDNPDNLPLVNHKDENKQNNNVNNLEWCSYQYNNTYGTCLIRRSQTRSKQVCQYDLNNKLIGIFDSIKTAGVATGINRNNITNVCKGKRNTAGGYKWQYLNERGLTE